jgi:hypothetical protein
MRVREKKEVNPAGRVLGVRNPSGENLYTRLTLKRLSCEQVKKTAGFSTRAYLCVRELENSAVFDEMRRK